jgi:uroporphyrinogen decarboxylase
MTSRERVLLALDHQPTDRAPADYAAHQDVTDRLIERLGFASEEELLQALGVDMRRVWFDYGQPASEPDSDGYVRDMWGTRRWVGYPDVECGGLPPRPDAQASLRTPQDLPDVIRPFDENTTVDDVLAHEWPDPDRLDYSGVRAACEKYYGEYATFGSPWSPFFHEVGWLIGQEDFFVWMTTKPDVVESIIRKVVDYEVEVTRRFLEAADGMIDITFFGNDFGTQRGLFISPEMYQRFIRKPLKRYFDVSREFGCRVMKHSCGAVRDIIPWFIEDGVEALDPVQVRAAGMDFEGLVRDFGERLTFHGGVDTQGTLPFGTEADVRREVRSYLDLMHNRGGYIVTGSQHFIADIPTENILAMYDENLRT